MECVGGSLLHIILTFWAEHAFSSPSIANATNKAQNKITINFELFAFHWTNERTDDSDVDVDYRMMALLFGFIVQSSVVAFWLSHYHVKLLWHRVSTKSELWWQLNRMNIPRRLCRMECSKWIIFKSHHFHKPPPKETVNNNLGIFFSGLTSLTHTHTHGQQQCEWVIGFQCRLHWDYVMLCCGCIIMFMKEEFKPTVIQNNIAFIILIRSGKTRKYFNQIEEVNLNIKEKKSQTKIIDMMCNLCQLLLLPSKNKIGILHQSVLLPYL